MKVGGSTASGASAPARASGGAGAAEGFTPELARAPDGAAGVARMGPSAPLGSLEALLALQETASPLERRRRAVRRASHILDALDTLQVAVLSGDGLDGEALQRLAGAVRESREGVEDPALAGVLEEIETRAAVELAKREIRAAA